MDRVSRSVQSTNLDRALDRLPTWGLRVSGPPPCGLSRLETRSIVASTILIRSASVPDVVPVNLGSAGASRPPNMPESFARARGVPGNNG
jgi:hypothetical protein